MKLRTPFRFTYNLEKKVVKDLKSVTETLPLEVSGIGYEYTTVPYTDIMNRYDADIESIIDTRGQEVIDHYKMMDIWDEIMEAAIREAARVYESQKEVV